MINCPREHKIKFTVIVLFTIVNIDNILYNYNIITDNSQTMDIVTKKKPSETNRLV